MRSHRISYALGSATFCVILPIVVALLFSVGKRFRNTRSRTKVVLWTTVIMLCAGAAKLANRAAGRNPLPQNQAASAASNHFLLQPTVHSPAARLLKDDRLHFSIDIPEGFREFPEGKQAAGVEYSFIRHSEDRRTACAITIEPFGRLLSSSRRLTRAQLPPDFNGEITQRSWRGLNIDVAAATTKEGGFITTVYSMHIPLRPKAIRVIATESGPQAHLDELARFADTLLASLDGETNW
jgi:hypothetical protein